MQLFFLSSTEQNFFTQTKRMGYFCVEKYFSPRRTRCCKKAQYAMTVGRCTYGWGSGGGGAVSHPAGPGQRPGGGPRSEAPGSSEDTSFYSTKNGPKIDAFLPWYCSRNYKNWQTKNISEINFYILHKREC